MEAKLNQILYKGNIILPLRGFCTVVEEGYSVTKAAKKIGLTQTTVTKQIQSLEDSLNTKLFNRTKNSICSLTDDGERLYKLAIPRLKIMESLFSEFDNDKNKNKVESINIAAHHVILSHILPKYIKEFRKISPDIIINLYNINREEALDGMKKHDIDFAIFPYEKIPAEFYSKILFEYDPYLMLNKQNPLSNKKDNSITVQEFLSQNLLTLGINITFPMIDDMIKTNEIKSNTYIFNGSWDILKGLIKQNLGATGIAPFYMDECDKDLAFINLSNIISKIVYKFVIMSKKNISNNLLNFLKIINTDIAKELTKYSV